MIKVSGIFKWLLVGILSFVMLAAALPTTTSYAADGDFPVSVKVSIPGGGKARIESIDYVARDQDPEQESYASQWIWEKDTAAFPAKTVDVPESSGEATISFNIPASKAISGNAYAFKITQVPGNDAAVIYDDKEYYLEVFILDTGVDGVELISVTAQVRDDSSFGVQEDYKPDKCTFENIETKTITRTIIYKEYDMNGKEILTRVIQTVTLERPKGSTGPWTLIGGDRSAVNSPPYSTDLGKWEFDREKVPEWIIDLNDPQDAVEYVFYTPPEKKTTKPEDTTEPTESSSETTTEKQTTTINKKSPKTGDATDILTYIILMAGTLATISVVVYKRRRRSED